MKTDSSPFSWGVLGLLKKFFTSLSPVWAKRVPEGNQLTPFVKADFLTPRVDRFSFFRTVVLSMAISL